MYERAAAGGDASAMGMLGALTLGGVGGLTPDNATAAFWCVKALRLLALAFAPRFSPSPSLNIKAGFHKCRCA